MPVINITGCRMFEDEIIYTLCNDPKIDEIVVIENDECSGITEKLTKCGLSYSIMSFDDASKVYGTTDTAGYVVTINILGLSLHGEPRYLREQVYRNVKEISEFSDGIFLFYGLCGNVLRKIEKDLEQLSCPISILKDNEGKIVDDCIGAVVGGRKSFLKMVSGFKRKSTIVMTPMWVQNWQEMFKHSGFIENAEDIEMAKFVLDSMGYESVVKINTGSQYTEAYHKQIQEFADIFQLNVLEVEGNQDLISKSYADFRDTIMRGWPTESATVSVSRDIFTDAGNESKNQIVKTV